MPVARKHQVRRVRAAVCSTPWAIEERALETIVELLQLRQNGFEFTEAEVHERLAAKISVRTDPQALLDEDEDDDGYGPRVLDGVAVLPVHGVLAPKMNLMMRVSGGTSTQQIAHWFQQALDNPDVHAILLDVDSPGGAARGNEELVQVIRAGRGQKPIKAVITGLGASAAYYVASAADEVIASPSSDIGSVGTFMIHMESSKADAARGITYTVIRAGENKAIGNAVEPLGSKGKAVLQEMIDGLNQMFVAAVAANRGVSVDEVQAKFGQGKTMLAQRAVEAGLIDRVGTLQQVFQELRAARPGKPAASPPGTSQRTREGMHVDPKVVQALVARGLITDKASEAEAKAALGAFFAGIGQAVPEAAADIVAALEKKPTEKPETDAGQGSAAPAGAGGGPTLPATSVADEKRIREAERARIQDLEARGELLGIDQAAVTTAIEQGWSIEQALVKWTDQKSGQEGAVTKPQIKGGEAEADKFAAAAVEVLGRRCGIDADKELSAQAKDLQYMSLLDIGIVCLRSAGQRVMGDQDDIARAVLSMGAASGFNRPSDFPNVLSALSGKMMDQALGYAPATYKEWAAQIPSVPDFKPKTIIAVGEFGELPRVPDGDDFQESTMGEEASWIAVDAYGDEVILTPKMMVDDDLAAFMEALQDKTVAHEMTINRLCVNLLTGNVDAADGNALFDDTNHGNDVTAGNPPSTTELSKMRLKLRKQTGVSAKRKLNLTLKTLLVPEDLETTTEQLLANTLQVVPTSESGGQIFRGRVGWVVEPMLGEASAVQYYGFADKRLARSIVYTFQRGFEQMKRRTYFNPKNNSQVVQVEGRFAAAVRNWRGVVRNAGSGAA